MELICKLYPRERKRAIIEAKIIDSLRQIIPTRLNPPLSNYNLSVDFENNHRVANIHLSGVQDFALARNTMIANKTFDVNYTSKDRDILNLIEKEIIVNPMVKFRISTDLKSAFVISGFNFPGFASPYFKTNAISIELSNFQVDADEMDEPDKAIRYDLDFKINNFSYFPFGQTDEYSMLSIKCLRRNKYDDAFKYAVELMRNHYQNAYVTIHDNGAFWDEFSLTVPHCGNIELLEKFFGDEYGFMASQSDRVIISKLKLSKDAKLISKSATVYELGGINIGPFKYTRISGYPRIVFDNFRCTDTEIHDFSITLIMGKPQYS